MSQNLKNRIVKDDEVDLIALAKTIWEGRKTILRTSVVFMLIGLFIAVFSKKEYTATTTFVSQTSDSKMGGGLGGLAAMAGINLGNMGGDSGISPELYPKIFNSLPFQLDLMQTLLTFENQKQKVSYSNYYTNIASPGVLTLVQKYTIGLPGVLISAIKGNPVPVNSELIKETNLLATTFEEHKLIKQISSQVFLDVNDKEGYVSISAVMPEATASAQLAYSAKELLQQYIINFKIKKSKEQLVFIKERYDEVEKKFKDIQLKMADFDDKNKFTTNAKSKIEAQSMRDEYDLVYGVFNELAKQLESQYIQVTEDTPVFTVLKPATIPFMKSKPKRISILLSWIMAGVFIGSIFVLGHSYFEKIKKQW